MLRISKPEPVDDAVTLRLEGRVVGAWVMELRESCEKVLAAGWPLKLHLAQVEFADANGVALLSSLRSRGVDFVECLPFMEAQLKGLEAD
jgi:ABC-type transporter Mla MlaB component